VHHSTAEEGKELEDNNLEQGEKDSSLLGIEPSVEENQVREIQGTSSEVHCLEEVTLEEGDVLGRKPEGTTETKSISYRSTT
jgi:hypothetical protein